MQKRDPTTQYGTNGHTRDFLSIVSSNVILQKHGNDFFDILTLRVIQQVTVGEGLSADEMFPYRCLVLQLVHAFSETCPRLLKLHYCIWPLHLLCMVVLHLTFKKLGEGVINFMVDLWGLVEIRGRDY